jgi:hypothetical protein
MMQATIQDNIHVKAQWSRRMQGQRLKKAIPVLLLFLSAGWNLMVLVGCASNRPPVLSDDPAWKAMIGEKAPALPFRVAVAPISFGYNREEANRKKEGRYCPDVDGENLRTDIVEVLKKARLFRDVRPIGKGDRAPSERAIEDRGWDLHYDLILFPKLKRHECFYQGITGWYIPNLLNWALWVWPSWWVADERYGSKVELQVRVRSVHSMRELYEADYAAEAVRPLDDFERGWQLAGILRVPGSLRPENWEQISRVVSPFALEAVKKQLALDFSRNFRRESRTVDFVSGMKKTLALVVGVGKHADREIPRLRFASRDAETFAGFLMSAGGAALPKRNVRVLVDERATLGAIRQSVRGFLARRARPADRVIIYFSGYGAVARPSPKADPTAYLVLHDARRKDIPRTALALTSLAKMLESVRAGTVIVILDTSFGPGRDVKTLAIPGEAPAEPPEDIFGPVAGMKRVLMASALPTQGALELTDARSSLFTYYLLQGLRGKADRDKDGRIALREIFDFVRVEVSTRSGLEGTPQTPYGVGTDSRDPLFDRSRPSGR